MPLPPLARLTVLGAVLTFVSLASATPACAAPPDGKAPEARDLRAWLTRIQGAATQRNFQGTFIVSGGGAVSSSRIAHYCEGKDQYERIDSLDGEMRQVLRHNEKVHVLWPQQRLAQVQRRELPMMSFPTLLQTGDEQLGDFYEIAATGTDRVAGHEADVLVVKAKDEHRYGYRLWAERASGLLLRADVLGDRGKVLETSAFSEVSINVRPQVDTVVATIRKLDGYRVQHPPMSATRLESEGWSLKGLVPGFRLVSCFKRPLESAERDGSGEEVVQTIFSDGLTHVSLFIEPYRSERHGKPMLASLGATQTLTQRHGDAWITVVGDVPAATLRLFASNLERKN